MQHKLKAEQASHEEDVAAAETAARDASRKLSEVQVLWERNMTEGLAQASAHEQDRVASLAQQVEALSLELETARKEARHATAQLEAARGQIQVSASVAVPDHNHSLRVPQPADVYCATCAPANPTQDMRASGLQPKSGAVGRVMVSNGQAGVQYKGEGTGQTDLGPARSHAASSSNSSSPTASGSTRGDARRSGGSGGGSGAGYDGSDSNGVGSSSSSRSAMIARQLDAILNGAPPPAAMAAGAGDDSDSDGRSGAGSGVGASDRKSDAASEPGSSAATSLLERVVGEAALTGLAGGDDDDDAANVPVQGSGIDAVPEVVLTPLERTQVGVNAAAPDVIGWVLTSCAPFVQLELDDAKTQLQSSLERLKATHDELVAVQHENTLHLEQV